MAEGISMQNTKKIYDWAPTGSTTEPQEILA